MKSIEQYADEVMAYNFSKSKSSDVKRLAFRFGIDVQFIRDGLANIKRAKRDGEPSAIGMFSDLMSVGIIAVTMERTGGKLALDLSGRDKQGVKHQKSLHIVTSSLVPPELGRGAVSVARLSFNENVISFTIDPNDPMHPTPIQNPMTGEHVDAMVDFGLLEMLN